MPKPDLTPLTGGYRRSRCCRSGPTSICDSQVILAEVERRGGGAPLDGRRLGGEPVGRPAVLPATVPIIFGEIGGVPEAFIEDREKLSGRPFDAAR